LSVLTGLERLLCSGTRPARRVALLTNHTGVDRALVPNYQLLSTTSYRPVRILVPEHGLFGQAQAGVNIPGGTGPGGLPMVSLYGAAVKPWAEILEGVDCVIYDIQDVGSRFYTYTHTMLQAMRAVASAGITFMVLDRPNPITGTRVEGWIVEPSFQSIVGPGGMPIRHGLTTGELALFFNSEFRVNCRLEVVTMRAWRRDMWSDQTGLCWIPPSPNCPTADTALVYPGTCLLEGTNISEGRGTTTPFQLVGAPWIDGTSWCRELARAKLPGVRFRPAQFIPTFSKYRNETCNGVFIHVIDREKFLPVSTGLELLSTASRMYQEFDFLPPVAGGRRFFDLLAGSDRVRLSLEQQLSGQEILALGRPGVEKFVNTKSRYLLY
jgi:uncharacterized protein YbbC (DUF1343 family)